MERIGRRAAFEWRANYATVGQIGIFASWFRSSFAAATDAVDDIFSVAIPLAGGGEMVHPGGAVPMAAGQMASLASPSSPVSARMGPAYSTIEIVIPRAVVEAGLAALAGTASAALLRFEPRLLLTSGAGAAVLRLVRFLIGELEQDDGLMGSPLIAARLADALLSTLLVGQPHNHAALLVSRLRPAEPAHVRRVAEYLDANAQEPVRMADLAAVAGVSVRAIQAGFRAHRDCSPMEFLRQRRLELARARLLSCPAATVTEIALESGFEHLGRFSMLYRARFGEAPVETLRRARGR